MRSLFRIAFTAMLIMGIIACNRTSWWILDKNPSCNPTNGTIDNKKRWQDIIDAEERLRGCMVAYWQANEGQSSAKLVEIDAAGNVYAQGAYGVFSETPRFDIPKDAGTQRFFQLFVFGSTLSTQTLEEQRITCQQKMRALSYVCEAYSSKDCWFFWRFAPSDNLSQMSCSLHPSPGSANPFPTNPPTTDGGPPDTTQPDPNEPPDCPDRAANITTAADVQKYASCTTLSRLSISGSALTGVSLPALRKVTGYVTIETTNALVTLGLPKLTDVAGYFKVSDNKRLKRLDLPSLATTGSYFKVEDNAKLTRIESNKLRNVGSYISIDSNPLLRTLTMPKLARVAAYISIKNNPRLCMKSQRFNQGASRDYRASKNFDDNDECDD